MKRLANGVDSQNDLVELLLKNQSKKFQRQLQNNSWDALIFGAGVLVLTVAAWLPTIAFNPVFQ